MLQLTERLSDHFAAWELADHHYNPRRLPSDPKLEEDLRRLVATVLEPFRCEYGRPLYVISGFRTADTNVRVGGAVLSQHMLARAVDCTPISLRDVDTIRHGGTPPAGVVETMGNFRTFAQHWCLQDRENRVGGLGLYPAWVHLDIRPRLNGRIAKWVGRDYGSEG